MSFWLDLRCSGGTAERRERPAESSPRATQSIGNTAAGIAAAPHNRPGSLPRSSFVQGGEFEALKRFGVYKELVDGTLTRIEGDKEFRIYCEDAEGWPVRVMTPGFCSMLSSCMIARTEQNENALSKFGSREVRGCRGMAGPSATTGFLHQLPDTRRNAPRRSVRGSKVGSLSTLSRAPSC